MSIVLLISVYIIIISLQVCLVCFMSGWKWKIMFKDDDDDDDNDKVYIACLVWA